MPKSETSLKELLYDIRRIEQHREKLSEKKIREIYRTLMKDLNAFLADEYIKYSDKDGRFYFSYLDAQNKRAKFLEEIVEHVNNISPSLKKEMLSLIDDTYQKSYDGMINAFKNADMPEKFKAASEAIDVNPDVIKQAVNNNISKLTLPTVMEKHRQEIIYQIQQTMNIGLMNGDRYETLAKKISERVDVSYNKAINIARTETHRVQESGLIDCAKDIASALDGSGMIYTATWRTMMDSRVRPNQMRHTKSGWRTYKSGKADHTKMEGVTIKVGDKFKLEPNVYADCPGMSGVARHDCRCRCYLDYDLMTEEEFNSLENKQVNGFTKEKNGGIIKSGNDKIMTINNIDSPIEQRNTGKGQPNAIIHTGRPLNSRQRRILDQLPHYDSRIVVQKKNVNMKDLAALTAETGDEFTMFTKGQERLIVRGNSTSVRIDTEQAVQLAQSGYKWSGHTHPGINDNCMISSPGDHAVLDCFKQKTSVIYNSKGQFRTFEKEE